MHRKKNKSLQFSNLHVQNKLTDLTKSEASAGNQTTLKCQAEFLIKVKFLDLLVRQLFFKPVYLQLISDPILI